MSGKKGRKDRLKSLAALPGFQQETQSLGPAGGE
jgi:hypothetical protein